MRGDAVLTPSFPVVEWSSGNPECAASFDANVEAAPSFYYGRSAPSGLSGVGRQSRDPHAEYGPAGARGDAISQRVLLYADLHARTGGPIDGACALESRSAGHGSGGPQISVYDAAG